MPPSTPFFAEFGPLLFGHPPRSIRDQLSAKLLQADSISGLREAFGPMILRRAALPPKARQG